MASSSSTPAAAPPATGSNSGSGGSGSGRRPLNQQAVRFAPSSSSSAPSTSSSSDTDRDDDDDDETSGSRSSSLHTITQMLMSSMRPHLPQSVTTQTPPVSARSASGQNVGGGGGSSGQLRSVMAAARQSSDSGSGGGGAAETAQQQQLRQLLQQPQPQPPSASVVINMEAANNALNSSATNTTGTNTGAVQSAPPSPTPQPPSPATIAIDVDGRYCWVCFATDEDDALAEWVQPCNCTGTIRWVHQSCLQRWVEEKQKGNSMRRVTCPQCQTEYIIVYPAMSMPVLVMERFDTMVKSLSPFLAAGILVGSLYWSAVTFGAVTVLQVVGPQEGLKMLEQADPLVMLVGLPAIPVVLVLGRMVRWEDMVLRAIRNRRGMVGKWPLLGLLMPSIGVDSPTTPPVPPAPVIPDQVSGTRIFCGALLLPTFSAIMGRVFFDSVQNNLHRTLIGGLAFVVLKGAVKIYFKQKQMQRKQQRKILDYTEDNRKRYMQQRGNQNQQQQQPQQNQQQQRDNDPREMVI